MNVSENYDAKIFAVATLMSSFLIYNSVKIIDQADIDYLELLARRTQVENISVFFILDHLVLEVS